jgi:hypothetical protein
MNYQELSRAITIDIAKKIVYIIHCKLANREFTLLSIIFFSMKLDTLYPISESAIRITLDPVTKTLTATRTSVRDILFYLGEEGIKVPVRVVARRKRSSITNPYFR